MNGTKLIVIDDFFSEPDKVRSWALSQEYFNTVDLTEMTKNVSVNDRNYFPGFRTLPISQLNNSVTVPIMKAIAGIGKSVFAISGDLEIVSSFQITLPHTYVPAASRVHTDNLPGIGKSVVGVASVVYLSPNPPENSGTSLYTGKNRTDTISNVYNRLIMYRADIPHAADDYFGTDKQTGRLTLSSFILVS
jgi:hypothetical protein